MGIVRARDDSCNNAAHRACGDRAGQRQQQPPNPLRRHPPVLGQPLRDRLPPRVQAAHPRRRHPHRRPRLLQGAADRLDVQLQSSRNSLLRHALHQRQVADLDPLRHSDHLRVLLAVSTRRPCLVTSIVARKLLVTGCSGGPFSSCRYQASSLPACTRRRARGVRVFGGVAPPPSPRVPRSRAASYRWPVREPRRTGGRCPATAAPGHAPVRGGACAFTRGGVVRGGGVMRCAGRRRWPCEAAAGLALPAPVARDTRRVGPRRRAVPAHG